MAIKLLLFVSPTLKTLNWLNMSDLATPGGMPALALESKVLRLVCEGAPLLRTIMFGTTVYDESIQDRLSASDAFFHHLQQQPNIRQVHVLSRDISIESIDSLCRRHPRITELYTSMVVRPPQQMSGLPTGMGVLAQLRTLVLRIHDGEGGKPGRDIKFADLYPLLGCHALSRLSLSVIDNFMQLGADDIHAMGRAWPNMERMELCADGDGDGGTPLGCLVDIAKAFGGTMMHVAHRFAHPDGLPTYEQVDAHFTHLEVLNVGPVAIIEEKMVQIAEFIGAVCPAGISLSDGDIDWAHVDELDGEESRFPDFNVGLRESHGDLATMVDMVHRIRQAERRTKGAVV